MPVRLGLQIVLFLLAVGLGLSVLFTLVWTAPKPPRVDVENRAELVEVLEAEATHHDLVVQAQGTVVPAQRVAVVPQVSGRVLSVSDNLVPGGRFENGERLLRIDPRDYQVALQRSSADVERARVEQQLEQGRQVVAEREWELFGQAEAANDDSRARALRQPQLRSAEVAVESAQSGVRRAQLDLGRTTIRAPFDGMVLEESVEAGQVVSPGAQIATLVGTDAFWVEVAVPVEALARIDVPGYNADAGSVAVVRQEASDGVIERRGRVLRLFTQLDPVGRLARLLVEVRDPLGLDDPAAVALPLLLGAYVDVEIDARDVGALIELPRTALREGNEVWLMSQAQELEVVPVHVSWRRDETVLVSRGIPAGARVVTSRIATPVAGMALRVSSDVSTAKDGEAAP